jgi:hypothetical protein
LIACPGLVGVNLSDSPVAHRWAVLPCGRRVLLPPGREVRVDWMLAQIDQRRVELEDQADGLRKQLAEVEEELVELAAASRVVDRFLRQPASGAPDEAEASAQSGGMIPRRGEGQLPEAYARLWRVVAGAPGPVTCKDCCREFDLGFEPRAVEGMRGKLKRLVERGWLTEPSPGRFTAAAAVRPISEP